MMTSEIQIRLNGESRDVPGGLSVLKLLETLELEPALIVVEHNGEILRQERYPEAQVEAGDSLELVHFVGGG